MSTVTLYIGPTAQNVFAAQYQTRDDVEMSPDLHYARIGDDMFRIFDEDADLTAQVFHHIVACDCEERTVADLESRLALGGTLNVVQQGA